MTTDSILRADLLDIIFENRNKSYGAYDLRKFYNDRLKKSLFIMLLISGITAFAMVTLKSGYKPPIAVRDIQTTLPPVVQDILKKPETPVQPAQPRVTPPTPNTQSSGRIEITNDPNTAIISDVRATVINVNPPGTGDPGPADPGTGETAVNPDPLPAADPSPKINPATPLAGAEIMPSYPGGMAALQKFLQKNLSNPRDLNEGRNVFVRIRFIVGFDGNLKGFEVTQDGGADFNNEVIRVLKKMPQWIPGKTRGENVSVYYTLPVVFSAAE